MIHTHKDHVEIGLMKITLIDKLQYKNISRNTEKKTYRKGKSEL